MSHLFTAQPLLSRTRPWWLPVLSLCITLFGILVLDWHVFPVIFFFWWEVILMVAAALIRMLFSLDGGGFFHNLYQRIFLLVAGGVLGATMIIFAILFSSEGMDLDNSPTDGLSNISIQTNIMTAGAVLVLLFSFFLNGRFRRAKPFNELMLTFAHLLAILAILQVFTMHLLPAYPQLEKARWVAVVVVVVKACVDFLFAKIEPLVRNQS